MSEIGIKMDWNLLLVFTSHPALISFHTDVSVIPGIPDP